MQAGLTAASRLPVRRQVHHLSQISPHQGADLQPLSFTFPFQRHLDLQAVECSLVRQVQGQVPEMPDLPRMALVVQVEGTVLQGQGTPGLQPGQQLPGIQHLPGCASQKLDTAVLPANHGQAQAPQSETTELRHPAAQARQEIQLHHRLVQAQQWALAARFIQSETMEPEARSPAVPAGLDVFHGQRYAQVPGKCLYQLYSIVGCQRQQQAGSTEGQGQ